MHVINSLSGNRPTVIIGDTVVYPEPNTKKLAMLVTFDICDIYNVKCSRLSMMERIGIMDVYSNGKPTVLSDHADHYYVCMSVAHVGNKKCLDELVTHRSWRFRALAAQFGNVEHLDLLSTDVNRHVKNAVVDRGYVRQLDVLVHDEECFVRVKIARMKHDYYLDLLVHDEEWRVRASVAVHGYCRHLDILMHDEDWFVRKMVVKHGPIKYMHMMANDPSNRVLESIRERGKRMI